MTAQQRSPPGTWRLLAPALIAWGLTAIELTRPGLAPAVGAAAGGAGLACAGVLAIRRRGTRERALRVAAHRRLAGALLLCCASVMLLGARVTLVEEVRTDPVLTSAAVEGREVELAVELVGYPETRSSPFGERHWARAKAETPRGAVPILLWLDKRPPERWASGTRLELRGEPQVLAPGDSAAFAVEVREAWASADQGPHSLALASSLASRMRNGLRDAATHAPGAELLPGFAVGDTSLVTEETSTAMLESSLSHLTAVSGANCALVTGAAMWILARLRAGRRTRLAVAALALAGFVALVGPDASVQRAAVMAAVMIASGFGGKRGLALPALGFAILVLLVADPWQALQPGFALSVAATAGILMLSTPLSRLLRRRARLPRVLALPVAVALAAQLACGPLLLLLQPGIPAIGVIANVIAAPAAPLGTGLGLLAALAAPVSSVLTDALVALGSLPARWVATTARLSAAIPGGRWNWPPGWGGAALLTACELLLLVAWAIRRGHVSLPGRGGAPGARMPRPRPWLPDGPAPRRLRIATALTSSAALGVFVGITLVLPATEVLSTPRDWAVVACDIGQGDAVLLRDPARPEEVMLVDTGDEAEKLERCLDRFGVRRISTLVLSHDDRDHVGALGDIVDRVDSAIISPTVAGERTEEREVVRQLRLARVPTRIGRAGELSPPGASPSWRLLAPGEDEPGDSNAASLVMMVRVGANGVLMLADTGLAEQEALLLRAAAHPAENPLRAEVVKVAHHGSRDQDPRLPAVVLADWALVSVGAENGYGHPARATLASLIRSGARVLRTDRMGSVALAPGPGGRLEPWVERSGVE